MDAQTEHGLNEGKIDGCDGASLFERYRLYRRLSLDIQSAALNNLPRQALLDQAKRIGLSDGKELLLNNPVELALVFDLAVYTAKEGRTRAIDRCARSRAKNATAEEALVLAGLCAARFSLCRMKAKIEPVGALLEDVMRSDEIQLLHDGLGKAAQPGDVAAIRVAPIGEFFIPCSAILPIYAKIADRLVGKFTDGEREALVDHPRFAASVYKTSITFGLVNNLRIEEGAS